MTHRRSPTGRGLSPLRPRGGGGGLGSGGSGGVALFPSSKRSRLHFLGWALAGGFVVLVFLLVIPSPSLPASIQNLKGSKGELSYCEAPRTGEEGVLPKGARLRQLKSVQLVIRHGDRSPITSLTSPPPVFDCKLRDPHMRRVAEHVAARFHVVGLQGKASLAYLTKALLGTGTADDETPQACFPGQLTERGLGQQLQNGRYLQERYGKALSIADVGRDVYFRSTNYPRTFQSGAALLLSFLHPHVPENVTVYVQEDNNKEALFGRGLIGASRPKSVDPLESPHDERGPCQVSFTLGATQEKAFLWDPILERDFVEQLQLGPSAEARDMGVADVTDPLMGMACHKHPLPIHRSLVRRLKEETDRMFCERFAGAQGGREGTRLGMQPFLREVLGRFQEQTASGLKLALYSAHDTVLSPLLGGLDVLKAHCYWPPYASRVVFEQWGPAPEEKEDGIRILYNGQVVSQRSVHCPNYPGGRHHDGEETLLPLGCFAHYVDSIASPDGAKEGTTACS